MSRIYGRPKKRFPWVVFLLLLGTVYFFWILPMQLGVRKVDVEFVPPTTTQTKP